MQRINSKNLVESFSARISADWVRLAIYTSNVITKNRLRRPALFRLFAAVRTLLSGARRRRDSLGGYHACGAFVQRSFP